MCRYQHRVKEKVEAIQTKKLGNTPDTDPNETQLYKLPDREFKISHKNAQLTKKGNVYTK